MENKTCKTCINNDDGLCDRKGILIHDDDHCDHYKENWREAMFKEIEKMDNSTILVLRNELMKKAVFQMPEDGSVEV